MKTFTRQTLLLSVLLINFAKSTNAANVLGKTNLPGEDTMNELHPHDMALNKLEVASDFPDVGGINETKLLHNLRHLRSRRTEDESPHEGLEQVMHEQVMRDLEGTLDGQHEESNLIHTIRFALEGVLVAIIANCGIFGNLLSMFILIRRKLDLQPFLCRLLVLLVVFDTIFLITDFLTYSLPMLSQDYHDRLNPVLAPKFLIPLSQIALTGSVYTIVAITVERYVSCCYPHVPTREGNVINAVSLVGIVVFSVVYNITRFFEYTVARRVLTDQEISHAVNDNPLPFLTPEQRLERIRNDQPLEIIQSDLRGNPDYIRYYLLAANCTVMVVIPLVSLVFLNWQIYKAIRAREQFRATLTSSSRAKDPDESKSKHNNEREVTISQILIAIVVMFFICQSFKVILVVYEVIKYVYDGRREGYPDWVEIVINLNHVALAINAAINIAIYICKDKKFRTACLEMVPCCKGVVITLDSRTESTQTNGSCSNNQAKSVVVDANGKQVVCMNTLGTIEKSRRQQDKEAGLMKTTEFAEVFEEQDKLLLINEIES